MKLSILTHSKFAARYFLRRTKEEMVRYDALFHQLLQALIEMAAVSSDERSLLESISNHIAARSGTDQLALRFNDD